MKLQHGLWALAGTLLVVVVVAWFVALANYEDDTAGGGSMFAVAWSIFEVAGVALIGTVVVAFILAAVGHRQGDEESPPIH